MKWLECGNRLSENKDNSYVCVANLYIESAQDSGVHFPADAVNTSMVASGVLPLATLIHPYMT